MCRWPLITSVQCICINFIISTRSSLGLLPVIHFTACVIFTSLIRIENAVIFTYFSTRILNGQLKTSVDNAR